MLLPDLKPWASEELGFVYDWTIQGNDLRLTTAMANIGTGVLELRGGEAHGDTQDVYQRVYNSDGSFTDVLAGEFVYHPEHEHIHFDDFADFRLREVLPDGRVGDVVAATEKVSFCLLDVEQYDASGPASPHYLSCEDVQGISVGWADVYDRGLPGQSIEITNILDGEYWLEVVVDPHNRLIESDETNNVERILITLERPIGENPIAPDTFESNDSFATASILAPPEDHTYENLSIHASLNDDYFRITASETGILSFDLAFQHAQGDVDMEIYDFSGALLGRSETATDNEHFSLSVNAGDFYFVRAYGYEGATNPDYTFIVDQPPGGGAAPDTFESNDSFATASILAPPEDHTYENLSIHTSLDDDYFRITTSETGILSFDLAFQHAQGDVDMEIYDFSGALLGRSETATDNEHFSLSANAGDFYFVRAYGYEGATNPDYTLIVDQPAGGGAPSGDVLIGEVIRPNGFDAEYYLATNADVALAGVDAWEHYSLIGWKEGFGRNPNAYFDTDGYLETYSDVKDAGVNPLEHFHENGWVERRDPSKSFDTDGYLEAYPDVDAAQVDPLWHYLQHGHAEERNVYDDGVWG